MDGLTWVAFDLETESTNGSFTFKQIEIRAFRDNDSGMWFASCDVMGFGDEYFTPEAAIRGLCDEVGRMTGSTVIVKTIKPINSNDIDLLNTLQNPQPEGPTMLSVPAALVEHVKKLIEAYHGGKPTQTARVLPPPPQVTPEVSEVAVS